MESWEMKEMITNAALKNKFYQELALLQNGRLSNDNLIEYAFERNEVEWIDFLLINTKISMAYQKLIFEDSIKNYINCSNKQGKEAIKSLKIIEIVLKNSDLQVEQYIESISEEEILSLIRKYLKE